MCTVISLVFSCSPPVNEDSNIKETLINEEKSLKIIDSFVIPLHSTYYWLCDYPNITEGDCRECIDDYFLKIQGWWHPRIFDISEDTIFVIFPYIEEYSNKIKGFNTKLRHLDTGWTFLNYSMHHYLQHGIAGVEDFACLIKNGLLSKSIAPPHRYHYLEFLSRNRNKTIKMIFNDSTYEIMVLNPNCILLSKVKLTYNLIRFDNISTIIETDNFFSIANESYGVEIINKKSGNSIKCISLTDYFVGFFEGCFYFITESGKLIKHNPHTNNSIEYTTGIKEIDDKSSFCIHAKKRILYIATLDAKNDRLQILSFKL